MKLKDRIKGLERIRASELLPNPKNWRTHPREQRDALRGVLAEVGIADALLVRRTKDGYQILDGHCRAEEAPDVEWPCLVVDLSDSEADKLLATHDPIGAMAEADAETLRELLAGVESKNEAVRELLATLEEQAGITHESYEPAEDPGAQVDRAEELRAEWGVERGQVWQVGRHRIMCGDSTKAEDVERLLGGARCTMLWADPPYGMNKDIENDDLHGARLDEFQLAWWRVARIVLTDVASVYMWGNAEDLWRLWFVAGLRATERLSLRNEIVWRKPGGMGIGTESQRSYWPSERCLFFMLGQQEMSVTKDCFWDGWEPIRAYIEEQFRLAGWGATDAEHITGVGMYGHWVGRSQFQFITREHYTALQAAASNDAFKREYDDLKREYDDLKREWMDSRSVFDNTHENMTDVWDAPFVPAADRMGHPTPKPVAFCVRAVKTSTNAGDAVLDPFLGTAPLLVACEQLGRVGYGMEISPAYVAVSLQRLHDMGLTCEVV